MKVTVRASGAPLMTPPTSTLHSLRSVSLSGSKASLGVLFAAADVTIVLAGINEDDNHRGGKGIVLIFKYCPGIFIDYWRIKNKE